MEYGYSDANDPKGWSTSKAEAFDDPPGFSNHLRWLDADGDYDKMDMDDSSEEDYSDDDEDGYVARYDRERETAPLLPAPTSLVQDRDISEDDRPDDPPLFKNKTEDQDVSNNCSTLLFALNTLNSFSY